MPDEKLVLVERFEELKTGMRVVVRPCMGCGKDEVSVLGKRETSEVLDGGPHGRSAGFQENFDRLPGCSAHPTAAACVATGTIEERRVWRFASDIGIDDQIAREANPYLSRSVVGTGGVDEVRVPAKERR